VCNIHDATQKIIAVAKVKANIVIHISIKVNGAEEISTQWGNEERH
jgi:hypothetical protein